MGVLKSTIISMALGKIATPNMPNFDPPSPVRMFILPSLIHRVRVPLLHILTRESSSYPYFAFSSSFLCIEDKTVSFLWCEGTF